MISLNDLPNTPLHILVLLSAEALRSLQDEVSQQQHMLKRYHDVLARAVSQKYTKKTQQLRQQLDKHTGVIRFDDGGIAIKATISKRPKWNQKKLADIAQRVRVNGEDPLEFMTVTYKVPESKYNAWPEHLRSIFADARTLEVSEEAFELSLKEEI